MTWRRVHAIRGATTVDRDDPAEVLGATTELLRAIAAANELTGPEIVSALFTVTRDLESEFPARAARELGWVDVALMCMTEIPVPGSLPRCIRVLVQVEFERPRRSIRNVYLREARSLRPARQTDEGRDGRRASGGTPGPRSSTLSRLRS